VNLVNTDAVEARIEDFIRTQFNVSSTDNGFGRTVDLFQLGYVDSVGFAELIAFLQEEFGVELPESDLLSDDFVRISGMARIVSRLTGEPAPGLPQRARDRVER
jgi:D-alanine--poly(phosphoribitol) ligase subunit 2